MTRTAAFPFVFFEHVRSGGIGRPWASEGSHNASVILQLLSAGNHAYPEAANAFRRPPGLLPADTERNQPIRIPCYASASSRIWPTASPQLACSSYDLHVAFFKFQCA